VTYYHLPTDTERSPQAKEAKPDGFILGRPEGGWDAATLAMLGFVTVVETARPADTATDTYVSGVSRTGDVVTRTWTARPWTAEELAAQVANTNRTALSTRVQAHIDGPQDDQELVGHPHWGATVERCTGQRSGAARRDALPARQARRPRLSRHFVAR